MVGPTVPRFEPRANKSRGKSQQLKLLVTDPSQLYNAVDGRYARLAFRIFVSLALLTIFIVLLVLAPI